MLVRGLRHKRAKSVKNQPGESPDRHAQGRFKAGMQFAFTLLSVCICFANGGKASAFG